MACKCKLIASARACKAQIYFSPSRMEIELFMIKKTLLGKLIFQPESFQGNFSCFRFVIRVKKYEYNLVVRHIPPFNCRRIANDGRSTRRNQFKKHFFCPPITCLLSSCSDSEPWINHLNLRRRWNRSKSSDCYPFITIHFSLLFSVTERKSFRCSFPPPRCRDYQIKPIIFLDHS